MITWTNNSTTNDNRWSVGETAEWYVTGELPSWVTDGLLSDVKPMFVFSQEPELTARGDTLVGSGSVSYNITTSTLTISENIGIDLNNWTVQIQQPNGTGKLRWPGWGAVSAKWADPGCHAWDANDGDLTHEITRTIELSGESGWTETAFTGSKGGIWRVSYDIPVQGATATTSTSRIVTLPSAVGARPNALERFTLGGEGGYAWNTYIYQCFDKVFTRTQPWTYKTGVIDRHTQYTDSNGSTYWVNHGVLRSCAGNHNQTCLYRDGHVMCPAGDFQLDWIPDNLDNIQDIFMPSSYQDTYSQTLLMNDGRLLLMPVKSLYDNRTSSDIQNNLITTINGTTTDGDTVALDNVTEMMAINQAHNEDCIVKTDDNRVWHVGGRTATITARQIPGLDADEIMFCQLGDIWDSAYVVYNDRPAELYRLTFEDGAIRDIGAFKWLNGVEACPNTLITLDNDEQFVHGCSNEFHAGFVTNKRIISYKCQVPYSNRQYDNISGNRLIDFSHSSNNIFFLGACSYSMAISIDDVPYLMSRNGYNGLSGYLGGHSNVNYFEPPNRTDPMCDYDSLAVELRKLHELAMLESFDSSISTANSLGTRTYADLQTRDSRFAVNQYTCVNSLPAEPAYNNTVGQTDCLGPAPTPTSTPTPTPTPTTTPTVTPVPPVITQSVWDGHDQYSPPRTGSGMHASGLVYGPREIWRGNDERMDIYNPDDFVSMALTIDSFRRDQTIQHDQSTLTAAHEDYIGPGKYWYAYYQIQHAHAITLDSLCIDKNTSVRWWSKSDYEGDLLLDVTGPKLIINSLHDVSTMFGGSASDSDADRSKGWQIFLPEASGGFWDEQQMLPDGRLLGEVLSLSAGDVMFSNGTVLSGDTAASRKAAANAASVSKTDKHNMHNWDTGSIQVRTRVPGPQPAHTSRPASFKYVPLLGNSSTTDASTGDVTREYERWGLTEEQWKQHKLLWQVDDYNMRGTSSTPVPGWNATSLNTRRYRTSALTGDADEWPEYTPVSFDVDSNQRREFRVDFEPRHLYPAGAPTSSTFDWTVDGWNTSRQIIICDAPVHVPERLSYYDNKLGYGRATAIKIHMGGAVNPFELSDLIRMDCYVTDHTGYTQPLVYDHENSKWVEPRLHVLQAYNSGLMSNQLDDDGNYKGIPSIRWSQRYLLGSDTVDTCRMSGWTKSKNDHDWQKPDTWTIDGAGYLVDAMESHGNVNDGVSRRINLPAGDYMFRFKTFIRAAADKCLQNSHVWARIELV